MIGSIQTAEPFARLLAAQTGCTVASVEYRLGPEHPHPAAIDDACAAWDARPPGSRCATAGTPGLIHGFTSVAGVVTSARRAIDEMCADVSALLAS